MVILCTELVDELFESFGALEWLNVCVTGLPSGPGPSGPIITNKYFEECTYVGFWFIPPTENEDESERDGTFSLMATFA